MKRRALLHVLWAYIALSAAIAAAWPYRVPDLLATRVPRIGAPACWVSGCRAWLGDYLGYARREMKCECCKYPLADCECDDMYPPPCARCFHCFKHCKCGPKYVETTPETIRELMRIERG